MKAVFEKKIFTAKTFLKDAGFLFFNIPKIIGVSRNKKIAGGFMERIMMVTTAVNGCVYCSWFHARKAVESGMSDREIRSLFNLQFQADATEFELPGLLYAQHFAETDRKPDPAMTRKLFDFYGDRTARGIMLVIRMIFFGNLYGNTWDAVLSRFKGRPARNSCIIFELVFFLLNFWIMFPAMALMKKPGKVT